MSTTGRLFRQISEENITTYGMASVSLHSGQKLFHDETVCRFSCWIRQSHVHPKMSPYASEDWIKTDYLIKTIAFLSIDTTVFPVLCVLVGCHMMSRILLDMGQGGFTLTVRGGPSGFLLAQRHCTHRRSFASSATLVSVSNQP